FPESLTTEDTKNTVQSRKPSAFRGLSHSSLATNRCFSVQPHLPHVLFYPRIEPALERFALRSGGANLGCGYFLVDSFQQVQCHTRKHEIARRRLLLKGFCHGGRGTQPVRQGFGDIAQRKSRTAGDDKRALSKQRLGIMPFGNLAKGVNSDDEKEAVRFS